MRTLVEKFKQMKDLEGQNMRNLYGGTFDNRLKNIDIDESAVTYNRLSLPAYKKHLSSLFSSQPQLVLPTARKPHEPLCTIVQYDQDSDQEVQDATGENLAEGDDLNSSGDEYNDEQFQDSEDDGFIVADDYYEETSFDDELDSGSRNMALIFKRQNKKRLDEQRKIMVASANEVRITYQKDIPK